MPFSGSDVKFDTVVRLFSLSMEERSDDDKKNRHRVKLYVLNEKRSWEDKGTGHVVCAFNDRVQANALTVHSEQDGGVMLESEIQAETVYNKQQETLIVWTENDTRDLALSFQEKNGCDEVWAGICRIQGRNPNLDSTHQECGSDSLSDEDSGENGAVRFTSEPIFELPPCEIGRLSELNDIINSCFNIISRREALANAIEAEAYIGKLLDLFQQCEDVEDTESLHLLYKIFKSIFYLNKSSLFDALLAPDHLVNVIGVLEYDPAAPTPKGHRKFLCEQAKFKEVIPISSDELTAKIHQTYRIQYIHDVIFPAPSIFEENLLSMMSTVIMYNKSEIVHLVQEDPVFLKQLFGLLESEDTPTDKLVDLAGFLKEFVTFSQLLNSQSREGFYKTLAANGILSALENCMSNKDETVRSVAVDILSSMIDANAAFIRDYSLQEDGLFINCLLEVMFTDPDPEMGRALQVVSIMKTLLDPESMVTSFAAKCDYDFLTFFYKTCMPKLCSPLFTFTTVKTLIRDTYRTANLINVLLDMLTFCFEHHTYHIRGFMVTRDLLTRVLVFLQSRHSFVVLSALRLFRKTVSLRDDYYYVYIVRHRLFDPVVKCFLANGSAYNLLNSALLELFEHIRIENIKPLIRHVVEEYGEKFERIDYVNTFQLLRMRYEQQMAGSNASTDDDGARKLTNVVVPLNSQGHRRADDDEEQWFNEEDEDDTSDRSNPPAVTSQDLSAVRSALAEVTPVQAAENSTADFPLPPLKSLRSGEDDGEEFSIASGVKPVGRRMTIVINTSSKELNEKSESASNCFRALVDYGDSDSDDEGETATEVEKKESEASPEGDGGEATAAGTAEAVAAVDGKTGIEFERFKSKKQRIEERTSPGQ